MKKGASVVFLFIFLISNVWAFEPPTVCYFILNHKMYYGECGSDDLSRLVEVQDADTISFVSVLGSSPQYAKDKYRVYHEGKVLKGLDPSNVKYLGGYPQDMCWYGFIDGYIKDTSLVFYKAQKIENADASNFEVIPPKNPLLYYAKDKSQVYKEGKAIDRDPSSFQLLDGGYSIDTNGIYYLDKRLEGALPENYSQDKYFLISNNIIYLNGEELKGYNTQTFEILEIFEESGFCWELMYSNSLFKDKNGIYFDGYKLDGVDINTFQLVTENEDEDLYSKEGAARDRYKDYIYEITYDYKLRRDIFKLSEK